MRIPRDSKVSKTMEWTDEISDICLLIEDEIECDCVQRGDHPCNLILEIMKYKKSENKHGKK